jgi:tetratricopeptide (TPR) repeat protein/tRNA A-37 threonylcarbamoyl transferase component Bud32
MDEPHNSGQHHEPGYDDLTGRVLGRFSIQSRIGQGGMGEVYLAQDLKLQRPVALKRIAPQWRKDPRFVERFRREVELASRLSHPHIAAVYDVFEYEDESFLVMEYVEGESLRRRLRGNPMPLDEFFEIARQCASALAAAHRRGVLHRDLKPENILLTRDGQVKILDFGLGKALPLSTESTLADTEPGLKGTPGYMAPEALLEKEVDARADLFSLGVVFYEMLAGRHPFLLRGDSFVITVNRVLTTHPEPVGSFNPQVTPQVEAILGRLLDKEPIGRYVSAEQLAADLKAAAGGSAITTPVVSRLPQPKRWRRLAAVTAAAALLASAGLWLYRRAARPAITTNDWILMTDLSNQTGKPIFDDTVTEAVRDALEQSRQVRLVPRSQAIAAAKLMGRTEVAKISDALGRQICLRDGYRGLLTGGIRPAPAGFVISVQIHDPVQGVSVYTDQAAFRQPAQLYPAVDRLARRLRKHLGESLAEIQKNSTPLAQVTTPSLEALQRYTRGVRRYNEGRYSEALTLFQSAISLDPDFAMAHLYSSQVYNYLGNLDAERVEMAKAMDGITRVSERERYLIRCLNLEYEGDYGGAAAQYRLLTELFPNDLDAWKGLGESAEIAGMHDQAIEAERRVITLNPYSGANYGHLVTYFAMAGNSRDALATYRAARQRGIDNTLLHRGAGIAYLVQGDPDSASEQFALCNRSGNIYGKNLASLFQSKVLLYRGKLSGAVDTLRAGLVLDIKQGSQAYVPVRRFLIGGALLAMGKRAEVRQEARELAGAAEKAKIPEAYALSGILAVRTGQKGLARTALSRLDKLRAAQPNSSYASSSYYWLLGAIALSEGRVSDALRAEQRAYAFYVIPGILLVQARAYAAEKQWDKAADSYRDFLAHAGDVFNYYSPLDWALAHLDLARALIRAGQPREAAKAYDAFLKLWAGADTGLKAVSEARAERVRISSPTTLLLPSLASSPKSIEEEKRLPCTLHWMILSGLSSTKAKCRNCSANT